MFVAYGIVSEIGFNLRYDQMLKFTLKFAENCPNYFNLKIRLAFFLSNCPCNNNPRQHKHHPVHSKSQLTISDQSITLSIRNFQISKQMFNAVTFENKFAFARFTIDSNFPVWRFCILNLPNSICTCSEITISDHMGSLCTIESIIINWEFVIEILSNDHRGL